MFEQINLIQVIAIASISLQIGIGRRLIDILLPHMVGYAVWAFALAGGNTDNKGLFWSLLAYFAANIIMQIRRREVQRVSRKWWRSKAYKSKKLRVWLA